MRVVRWYTAGLVVLGAFALSAAQETDPVPAKKIDVPAMPQESLKVAGPKGVAELQKGRGKLFVKENIWDFGFVSQDAKISHEFFIQNVGDDTLFVERIKPT